MKPESQLDLDIRKTIKNIDVRKYQYKNKYFDKYCGRRFIFSVDIYCAIEKNILISFC